MHVRGRLLVMISGCLLAAACDKSTQMAAATPTVDAGATADSVGQTDSAVADSAAAAVDIAVLPLDRPTLDWTGTAAAAANKALLPGGFNKPDPTVCAPDTKRIYIAELFLNGLKDIQVDYHWAPVLPGPDAAHRTLHEPEFSLAGELLEASEPGGDVLADHPFGSDVNCEVQLDAPYSFLSGAGSEDGGLGLLHAEIEDRMFPRVAFGFTPKPGDRGLMHGVWILDCGHPPYGTEMHPPTFIAYARTVDAHTATALAWVAPYRSSLLFNPDVSKANALEDIARYTDEETRTFPHALLSAVVMAVAGAIDHLTTHGLMAANRFGTLDWQVCAPAPRPANAQMTASWRFTTRTGVTVAATPDQVNGCVRFVATMDDAYVPMALPYADAEWSWQGLSLGAGDQLNQSIDVRKQIIKIVASMGLATDAPALQADHPPRIDAYAMLQPRAGADQDAPTAIDTHADDQPFPFYGRARVAWQIP